jgi:hypothetical protein
MNMAGVPDQSPNKPSFVLAGILTASFRLARIIRVYDVCQETVGSSRIGVAVVSEPVD